MMVRNESRVIDRALDSVLPHVDAWLIADTGSTDDTPAIVSQRMQRVGLPGRLLRTTFVDFGTSRTECVEAARQLCLDRGLEYLLLLDADEVVEVLDPGWKGELKGAPLLVMYDDPNAYRIPALLPAAVRWRYVGRTHEYIEPVDECPPPELFDGIVLHDHADGGCKSDKFQRDLRLLEQTLTEDPNDERAWFYLGETFYNGDIDIERALDAYCRRAEMGGFEEEAWYAAYRQGLCFESLDEEGDPWTAILAYFRAWERRPWRAEPLFEVVRLTAQRGMHGLGAATSIAALENVVPRPERSKDLLFVDRPKHGAALWDWSSVCLWWSGHADRARDLATRALSASATDGGDVERIRRNLKWCETSPPETTDVYDVVEDACTRLRENGLNEACLLVADGGEQLFRELGLSLPWRLDFERSICGWYVPGRREDGARLTHELLDRRDVPSRERAAVGRNLRFYIDTLPGDILTSDRVRAPEETLPPDYTFTNPSVAFAAGRRLLLLRGVNYRIREDGTYAFDGVIHTRNVLFEIDRNGRLRKARPLVVDDTVEEPETGLVRGFEDCRLFALPIDGSTTWWAVANRSHPRVSDRRAMFLLRLEIEDHDVRVTDALHLHGFGDRLHQKNWMPVVAGDAIRLVYSVDPTIVLAPDLATGRCEIVAKSVPPFPSRQLRGGSGLVEIGEGWLAFVHGVLDEGPPRRYYHRIVRFGPDLTVKRASKPFLLRGRRLEFVAGCTREGEDLLITWGEDDARAWIGRMSVENALDLTRRRTGTDRRRVGRGCPRHETRPSSPIPSPGTRPTQTVVTGLFDLERRERIGRRSAEAYVRDLGFVLDLGLPMVVYVDPHLAEDVRRLVVERNARRVHIVTRRLEDLSRHQLIDRVESLPPFDNANPHKDTSLHQIVAWSKTDLLVETIEENPFATDHFAWIDAGIGHVARPPKIVPTPIEEIAILQMRAVAPAEIEYPEAFLKRERGRIAGGFFRGGRQAIRDLAARFDSELEVALRAGLRPTEQALLSLISAKTPEDFRFFYGNYRSILRNWDGIRGEVSSVLDNVAHCRKLELWGQADEICRQIGQSVEAGALDLDAEIRTRWFDEWLVTAWNVGDQERCLAMVEELRGSCSATRYYADERERLDRNIALVHEGKSLRTVRATSPLETASEAE